MDWADIFSKIIIAVGGALLLSFIYWLIGYAKQQTPLIWFVVDRHMYLHRSGSDRMPISFCTVLVRNKSRSVINDVKIYFDEEVSDVDSRDKHIAKLSNEDKNIVLIPHFQAKQEVRLRVRSDNVYAVDPLKILVGGVDQGKKGHEMIVKEGSVVLPPFFASILFPVLFSMAIGISVFGISEKMKGFSSGDPGLKAETKDDGANQ